MLPRLSTSFFTAERKSIFAPPAGEDPSMAKPPHEVIADLHAQHEIERKAWNRLLHAERAFSGFPARQSAKRKAALEEVNAALQALRALGVEITPA